VAFTLDEVVPWGRSFEEHLAMFALSDEDLRKRILGCGDGPASFNSVLTKRGGHVISVDPVYQFSAEEIRSRIDETYEKIMEQTRRNMDEFVWRHIPSIEELGRTRMAAMEAFLVDYPVGLAEGRYVNAGLPSLPFEDGTFDIAVCSHLLFLYSEQLSAEFHVQSIKDLCRVATETRVFPLLELGSRQSRHLDVVCSRLQAEGYAVNIEIVPYEFQRGGNEMLTVIVGEY
jgi:SAM-dependent methyltransferase